MLSPQSLLWGDTLNTLICRSAQRRLLQDRLPPTGSLIRDSLSTGSLSAGSLMPFSLFVLNQPVWDRFIALMSITYWDAYSWRLTEKRRS